MPYYPNCTIPATSSSSTILTTVVLDFGHAVSGESNNSNTVTVSAPWFTDGNAFACVLKYGTNLPDNSLDHGGDDAMIEGVNVSLSNFIEGVSFDITASAPNGTWGRYNVDIISQ